MTVDPCSCDESDLYRNALERIAGSIGESRAQLIGIAAAALAGITKGVGSTARTWTPTEPVAPTFPWAGTDVLERGPTPLERACASCTHDIGWHQWVGTLDRRCRQPKERCECTIFVDSVESGPGAPRRGETP